jgi:hypothetical protein
MNLELETYPPLFRQLNNQSCTHGKVIEPVGEPEPTIPVIDLHGLSPEELGGACRDWGLFRLVNHGVPSTLLRQLHEHAKELFSLSFECKKEIFCSPSSYLWGTTATSTSGAALLTGPQNIHWVEGFHFPLGQLSQLQTQDPTLASFRYVQARLFFPLCLFSFFYKWIVGRYYCGQKKKKKSHGIVCLDFLCHIKSH